MPETKRFETLREMLSAADRSRNSPFMFLREVGKNPLRPAWEASYNSKHGILLAHSSLNLPDRVDKMIGVMFSKELRPGERITSFESAGKILEIAGIVEEQGFEITPGRAYAEDDMVAEVFGKDVSCHFGGYDFQSIHQQMKDAVEEKKFRQLAVHLGPENFIMYLMFTKGDPNFLRLSDEKRQGFFSALLDQKKMADYARDAQKEADAAKAALCDSLRLQAVPSYVPEQSVLAIELLPKRNRNLLDQYLALLKHYQGAGEVGFRSEVMSGEYKTFKPDFSAAAISQFTPAVNDGGDYIRVHMQHGGRSTLILGLEGNDDMGLHALEAAKKLLKVNEFQPEDYGMFFSNELLAKRKEA